MQASIGLQACAYFALYTVVQKVTLSVVVYIRQDRPILIYVATLTQIETYCSGCMDRGGQRVVADATQTEERRENKVHLNRWQVPIYTANLRLYSTS